MESMSAMAGEPSPEGSDEYLALFGKGVLVKTVSHDEEGSDEQMNVEDITEQDIPDAKFAVPDGYKKMSFAAMFGMASE